VRVRLAILAAATVWALACAAHAQDDGPRVYQLVPKGAQIWTGFAVAKRGNEEPEVGTVIPGSDIDTNLLVLRYATTVKLGEQSLNPFIILPTGEVTSTIHGPTPTKNSSSGLGDIQIGGVFGLVGLPALSPTDFAGFKPGFTTGLFAKVYLPTGAYSGDKPVNLGSNRYAFQVGLPSSITLHGESYRDPRLTTLEVFPTLTFYAANTDPYGAVQSSKDPLFTVEAHLTHNLSQRVWISGDLLYRQGGETTTNGMGDGNGTHGLSGGGTFTFPVTDRAVLALTYEAVIARDDDGPDGWFFRTALILPF
jgi:hypothetical protein